ncbi:hypothetical protein GGQ68_002486 [Sagittula marina]|uniref:Uncharacterized protein n=1 Tax=Sagittula marina TaxID=943940 RepID=A0A7W6GT22_9RHOB|nr:hypothetical protein [Sagittula marina]MBB3986148.1 hypothetical protein [Sagittula marina]
MSNSYDIRTLEQELNLLDQGEFLGLIQTELAALRQTLRDHQLAFGGKPKGKLTLSIEYEMHKNGDVAISGDYKITPPKTPKAMGAAYVNEGGQLSLHSPMLRRAHEGIRDVTGERDIRDA